jgi:hypothetical protein
LGKRQSRTRKKTEIENQRPNRGAGIPRVKTSVLPVSKRVESGRCGLRADFSSSNRRRNGGRFDVAFDFAALRPTFIYAHEGSISVYIRIVTRIWIEIECVERNTSRRTGASETAAGGGGSGVVVVVMVVVEIFCLGKVGETRENT